MSHADEVILLVGGRGTRLRSVVSDVPKPLAPVAGRPFLAWLLDSCARQGMRRAILATGYRAEQIQAFAGNRWQGMEVVYSHEQSPLGTGGAIARALPMVRSLGVHLINGDTWLDYQPLALEAATRTRGCRLGVALARVPDIGRYGAVEVQAGRVTGFREKGGAGAGWINAGSYFLAADGMAALPSPAQGYSFEERVLTAWAGNGDVAAFTETDAFIDIGVPEDFDRAQGWFGRKQGRP